MWQLSDSHTWRKLVAKEYKETTHAKQGQDLESEDESDDHLKDKEQHNDNELDNQSDNCSEVWNNPTLMHGQSSRQYLMSLHLQWPRSRSHTTSRQQLARLGTPDGDVIHPHPLSPPRSTIHNKAPRHQSTQHTSTPVDLRSHEALSGFPNNQKRSAVPLTRPSGPSRSFRSQLSPPGNPTQCHARTYYEPFPDSALPNSLALPLNSSLPRQGTKQHKLAWSNDGSTEFNTGPHFHHIDSQGRLIP